MGTMCLAQDMGVSVWAGCIIGQDRVMKIWAGCM
jgi:hypothetical protein